MSDEDVGTDKGETLHSSSIINVLLLSLLYWGERRLLGMWVCGWTSFWAISFFTSVAIYWNILEYGFTFQKQDGIDTMDGSPRFSPPLPHVCCNVVKGMVEAEKIWLQGCQDGCGWFWHLQEQPSHDGRFVVFRGLMESATPLIWN